MEQRRKEVSWQSVVGALVVSAIIAMSYPFVILKVGMGPNISVVAAFFGAILLNFGIARKTRGQNRYMNNLIQGAATAASGTAFMCVIAAAFYFISEDPQSGVKFAVKPLPMFVWLTLSGWIGVLLTTLFRRPYLDDKEMVFADGVAALETVKALDETSGKNKGQVAALGITAFWSAHLAWFRDAKEALGALWIAKKYNIGLEYNLLSVGSGLLVTLRVALSMLAGSMVVWLLIGPWLVHSGTATSIALATAPPENLTACQALTTANVTSDQVAWAAKHCGQLAVILKGGSLRSIIVKWAMWPATALMLTSALTALALRWRTFVNTFKAKQKMSADEFGREQDIAPRTVFLLGGVLTALLGLTQYAFFGATVAHTVVAVLGSLVLMLVGIRVLGETNQGPVSLMSNAAQALYAVFWKDLLVLNLVAAGTSGSISALGEGGMQSFRTARTLGSSPRVMTWFMFAAVPIGSLAVVVMYPLLVMKYGIGGEHGLSAPTSVKLASMAVVLHKGTAAFPAGALLWTVIAGIIGVAFALIDHLRDRKGDIWTWLKRLHLPSTAGFGFALILPGELNIMMAIGGIVGYIWHRNSPDTYAKYMVVVASGFIAGDAIVGGVLIPVLSFLGLL